MLGEDDNGANGEINKTDPFQRLQSTFILSRRARPPPMEFAAESEEHRVPLKADKLHRRESKGGLRGIFTRNKTEKNAALSIPEEPGSAISQKSINAIYEKSLRRSDSLKRVATLPRTPANPPTPMTARKQSRMNLRSKSVKQNKAVPKPSPKSSIKSSPKPTRTSAAWDPPPLFQAYPQAIKHATLSASTLSADSILRISNHKRNNSLRDEIAQNHANGEEPDQVAAAKKADKAKTKHRRQLSGSISKADWTQKIFVLVTSGYLLQYAGQGNFDRLPEKMMQLGKDSVAFASDVIPGKHWVLQISQSMDADGLPAADSRSLLSRLAFRGADYRRTATSLLLVLNSAEDLDSWMAVVRREIEALGGKKHVSETGKPKPDDKIMQLRAQPSHRYLVERDPGRFSNPASPTSPSFGSPPWTRDDRIQERLEDAASSLARPQTSIRPSTGHQSVANSVVSHDGLQLESLRDSANRLSFMSSGQRTLVTSQGSSATSSPTRESKPSFDEIPATIQDEDVRIRPNAAAINERRRSMQTIQVPVLQPPPAPKNYRHSTFAMSSRPHRSHSPTTLNFSTPRRFPSNKAIAAEVPPIPTIVTTTPKLNRSRDTLLKGTRKAPPVTLTTIRPLSPVEDVPSYSKRTPPFFTPTESSFQMMEQIKPLVIDIPPRPATATPRPSTAVDIRPRISSLMPISSAEIADLDFEFPQRFSGMRTFRSTEKAPDAPLRAAPPPPNTLAQSSALRHFPDQKSPHHRPTNEGEKESVSPLPVLANTKQKLRRPTSMQVRPPSTSPAFISAKPTVSPSRRPMSSSPTTDRTSTGSSAFVIPPYQRITILPHPKAVANKKSMPMLVNGPPPAPPPDCALPPLPPGSAELRSPETRNSVLV